MAIDKNATTPPDVDLDDIEVVILIIAKSPPKISQAANFLSRRGWPTTTMNSLSQAIEFATARKPDFVLISVNHPNPAIAKFSDLLTTTFGTTCVAFAENMDTASSARLAKSSLQLKIQGQASGPNLHRSLRKILAEKLNIQLDEKTGERERASAEKNISVKGGLAGDGQSVVQKGDNGPSAGKGPTMIKGENPADGPGSKFENESISTGKYTMSKKNRRTLKDISANPLDVPGDTVMGEASQLAEKLKRSLFGENYKPEPEWAPPEQEESVGGLKDDAFSKNLMPEEDDEEASDGSSVTSRRSNGGPSPGTSAQLSAENKGEQKAIGYDGKSGSGSDGPNAQHGGAIGHPGYKPGSKSLKPGADGNYQTTNPDSIVTPGETKSAAETKKSLQSVGPHSLIERAVQEALAKICRPSTGGHEPIALIEQVGVFPIDSPTLPGYLVLAWPHEEMRAIEPFFKQAQLAIDQKFAEIGVRARLEPGFFVSLPQVEFASWASEAAAFSFSTSHGNEEIGVAFFNTTKPIPQPKEIEDKTMFSIDLDTIATNTPVNFKVYLHMKKNKKYFLYLRNGRQLQPEQKERLEDHKIKDLYMKSIDVENLRMFLATSYLREKMKKAG